MFLHYQFPLLNVYNLKKKEPFLKSHNGYFKFDFYLSVDTLKGIAGMSSAELNNLNINANIFFENIEEALSGMYGTDSLINENPFTTIPSNSEYACLKSINSKKMTVDTKNATRVAFQTFSPIPIDSSYNGNELPTKTIIYQGGKQLPSVENNVYDLGGILPEEYNLAIKEINAIYDINIDLDNLYVDLNNDGLITNDEKTPYLGAYNRYLNSTDIEMSKDAFCVTSDVVNSTNYSSYYILVNGEYVTPTSYNSSETYYNPNNKIWQSPATISGTNYLGVQNGVRTKMKITMYFWYEGYDADCLRLIDFKPTNLNVLLSTDKVITNS